MLSKICSDTFNFQLILFYVDGTSIYENPFDSSILSNRNANYYNGLSISS
jgi:hypothetical protein